jgi:hypothetical protein
MASDRVADCKRCEAGFDWFEKTLGALNDAALKDTIYAGSKQMALMRMRALRDEVLFLYALLIRETLP